MKLVFLSAPSAKESWYKQCEEVYLTKIKGFLPVAAVLLKTPKIDRLAAEAKKRAEQQAFLEFFESDDYVVVFDEKGKKLENSESFSKTVVVRAIESGKKRVVFVIGGAYGVGDDVRKRAQQTISLSGLTMNHLMAQAMAYEQVYRALTIWKNIPYHN